ncbi:hypothetical protein JCM8115_006786 [Rhodotorula mucilaginosa]|uniref:Uncharacterized protein n=1 Tax=Rhodotorula mucilaginosa TaxID=5537 RepID=A0A9P6W3K8_RHOMI|nr:hypothetical protein C6P46_003965 [Rhodotorula mucilaginosa]TKA54158.1 hypothetical protein B0A53_03535 [Rhodotorula sp. CCFEE 5036]
MLRLTLGQVSHRLAPHAVRGFAAAAPLQNKASRSGRKVKWTPQSAPRATPVAGTPTPGQAGTDVGQGGTGLFEGEAPPAAAAAESSVPTPEQIEKEMLDAQPELQATEQTQDRPNHAGTDVAQGGAPEANSQAQAEQQAKSENYGPEEVIYTSTPTYNPAVMLSLCLVMSIFSFSIADFARVGVELYDEETGELKNAPAWKRYLLAGSAATIGTGLVVAGVWAPTRNVVKITLRRTANSAGSPVLFPQDSLATLYNPLSPISQKLLRQRPRSVPLSKIHLLGQLSDSPKSYHPRSPRPVAAETKTGIFSSLLDKVFPSAKPSSASASRKKARYGHSPIVVEGDRFSMSLKTIRADEPFSTRGAWCRDWDALERALLHVDESRWTSGTTRSR